MLFSKYKDIICLRLEENLSNLCAQDGAAFDESRPLHREVFPYQCPDNLNQQKEEILMLIRQRLNNLEALINNLKTPQASLRCTQANNTKLIKRINLSGLDYTNYSSSKLPSGVYIEMYTNGGTRKIIR